MRPRLALVGALLALSILALSACNGDDVTPADGSPTSSSGPTATPDESVRAKALIAVADYIRDVGIEGETGTLTDPVECPDTQADEVKGDYCVAEPGVYAPGLALVLIADPGQPDVRGWQVRVVFADDEWTVTEVVSLAAE